jgi:O-antigen ligase
MAAGEWEIEQDIGSSSAGREWLRGAATLAVAALVGVAACGAAVALSGIPTRRTAALSAAFLMGLGAIASGHGKRILLFFWVVCLTYNRNYMIEALGNHGSYGLYWIPADVFLLALYLTWIYEVIAEKQPLRRLAPAAWPWFLPFAAACLISIPGADRMDWGLFESARLLRLGLVLFYFRFNVGVIEWWVAIAGLAAAVCIQFVLGAAWAVAGTQLGLAGVFGVDGVDAQRLKGLMEGGAPMMLRRAEGTFGHANTLAVYLLLVTPVFLALAVAPIARLWRVLCFGVGITALAGIALTMSRTSWLLITVQCLLLAVGLSATRLVSLRHTLGALVVGGALIVLAAMPVMDKIERRITGDFAASIDFRARHDRIALEIWQEKPFFGIGLNQYSDTMARRGDPEVVTLVTLGEFWRRVFDIRVTAWVHNIYLLILAETGVFGLTAFLFFIGSGLALGLRAVYVSSGAWQAASLGLLVGMLGLHGHGLQESALWIDPITCSFTVVFALLNAVPSLSRSTVAS